MYSYVILVHHCGHVGDIDGSCHAADGEGSGKPEELHNVINEWIKKRVTCPIRTGTKKLEEGLVKEWRKGTREKRKCAEGKSQERARESEKWKMPRERTECGSRGRNNFCRFHLIS